MTTASSGRTSRRNGTSVNDPSGATLTRDWNDPLGALRHVGLEQLDTARLHDRIESKVILHEDDVAAVVDRLSEEYLVLEHEGERVQRYRTEYFDDLMLRSYHDHHNQKANRNKVRYRTYTNSDLTFLEIKRSVHGRTVKQRRQSSVPIGRLWPEDVLFVHQQTGLDPWRLFPSLTVEYDRVLLVRADFSERVTIDLDLSFASEGRKVFAKGLAVCEFKQTRLDRRSPAIMAVEQRPQKFSKYCTGLAACHPSLRQNRFKAVFRSVAALNVPFISS